MNKRSCGNCTKCCEGTLSANINGHEMYPGKHCHFLKDWKCTIYKDRPHVCKEFMCGWLEDDGTLFDEWMKPNIIDSIFKFTRQGKYEWYDWISTGKRPSANLLNYIIDNAIQKNINLVLHINNKKVLVGSDEFKTWLGSSVGK